MKYPVLDFDPSAYPDSQKQLAINCPPEVLRGTPVFPLREQGTTHVLLIHLPEYPHEETLLKGVAPGTQFPPGGVKGVQTVPLLQKEPVGQSMSTEQADPILLLLTQTPLTQFPLLQVSPRVMLQKSPAGMFKVG